jgi:anti-sigma-K factor RskA
MSTDIHTLAGAYALDALTDIERAAFARHVASCESCAQELAELSATVARLTDATAATPPARLKASVLAEVGRTRQVAPGRPEAPRARRGWRGLVAAAAAVVVLAAGGVGYLVGHQGTQAARTDAARIEAVLEAPDARVTTQKLTGGGQVTVIVSPSRDQGVAVLAGMPALDGGQVYQLWLMRDGTNPVSTGVMDPGQDSGTAFIPAIGDANQFGVSQERAGGSKTPTQVVTTVPLNA